MVGRCPDRVRRRTSGLRALSLLSLTQFGMLVAAQSGDHTLWGIFLFIANVSILMFLSYLDR